MYKTLLATLLTVLLSSVSASEFSTLLQLEHLRDAEVITQEHRDSLEKIYPKGSVRRISGKMRYSGEVLVRGSVDVLTVQLCKMNKHKCCIGVLGANVVLAVFGPIKCLLTHAYTVLMIGKPMRSFV